MFRRRQIEKRSKATSPPATSAWPADRAPPSSGMPGPPRLRAVSRPLELGVVRDGRTIAVVGLQPAPNGGLLVSGGNGCSDGVRIGGRHRLPMISVCRATRSVPRSRGGSSRRLRRRGGQRCAAVRGGTSPTRLRAGDRRWHRVHHVPHAVELDATARAIECPLQADPGRSPTRTKHPS